MFSNQQEFNEAVRKWESRLVTEIDEEETTQSMYQSFGWSDEAYYAWLRKDWNGLNEYTGKEKIVGWFHVCFKPDIDHDYQFIAYNDGRILPDPFLCSSKNPLMFFEYLSDKNFHKVRFYAS